MLRITSAVLLLCTSVAPAQTDKKLMFEVATIKPAAPQGMGRMRVGGGGGPGTPDPGQMRFTNMPLRMLIMRAYNVQSFQVSGPGWLDSERFDVLAKVPKDATRKDVQAMFQNLLADRFKLVLHKESKQAPIYVLVVAKGGIKMKPAAGAPQATAAPDAPPPGPPTPPEAMGKDGFPKMAPGRLGINMFINNGRIRMQGNAVTTARLAETLSMSLDRPVTDETGLTGKYDITLDCSPEGLGFMGMRGEPRPIGLPPGAGGGVNPAEDPRDSSDAGPTIFTALQEQLGLKLESRKGPVDLLVIDSVEKTPTEN